MTKQPTKIASRKARGRLLQQKVRDAILKAFPALTIDDVKSTGMGQSGSDVQLSTIAKEFFPYDIECKNAQSHNIWAAMEQSQKRCPDELDPLLVVKRNGVKPLAIVDFEHFMMLVYAAYHGRIQ